MFSPNTISQSQSLLLNFAPAKKKTGSVFHLFCVHHENKGNFLNKSVGIISNNMCVDAMDTTPKLL